MNKNILPLIITALGLFGLKADISAQVPRNVVVEHFTNTRCGICGSRNPGLVTNLSTSPDVLHVSYHPSRPYSSCVLNQHNVSENDDRAKHYGVYGSTPRDVVQGSTKGNGESFTDKALFSSELGQTSPVDVQLTTLQKGKDSLEVRIVIKNVATNSLKDMSIYAVAEEDTVFYNAPNGEKEHHNVFRKALLNEALTIPNMVGDSVVFIAKTANHVDWDASRMYVMAFVQTADKKIEQVASSEGDADIDGGGGTNSLTQLFLNSFSVYPNPASATLTIKTSPNDEAQEVVLTNVMGMDVVHSLVHADGHSEISTSDIPNGTYFVKVISELGQASAVKKIVVIH